jgi:DNA-binding MarR family transcriptional regulator
MPTGDVASSAVQNVIHRLHVSLNGSREFEYDDSSNIRSMLASGAMPKITQQSGNPTSLARPSPDELEALSRVQLIAPSFRRARGELPESLKDVFNAHGLAGRHGAVLTVLIAGEPASVSDIARRLHVSLSTASELVSELAAAGLVTRRDDAENRRRTMVSVPSHVRPVVESFIAVRSAPLLRAMARLSARDRQGFLAGLTEWASEELEST